MNLKYVLMELGNRLVVDFHYDPAVHDPATVRSKKTSINNNTSVIKDFTKFLNDSKEARFILEQMGIEWPIVRRT